MRRDLWWPLGGGAVSYERGNPVTFPNTFCISQHSPFISTRVLKVPKAEFVVCKGLRVREGMVAPANLCNTFKSQFISKVKGMVGHGEGAEDGFRVRYRGTSLISNSPPLGPYSRTMPRALWWSWGGGVFLMNEVPLHGTQRLTESILFRSQSILVRKI